MEGITQTHQFKKVRKNRHTIRKIPQEPKMNDLAPRHENHRDFAYLRLWITLHGRPTFLKLLSYTTIQPELNNWWKFGQYSSLASCPHQQTFIQNTGPADSPTRASNIPQEGQTRKSVSFSMRNVEVWLPLLTTNLALKRFKLALCAFHDKQNVRPRSLNTPGIRRTIKTYTLLRWERAW